MSGAGGESSAGDRISTGAKRGWTIGLPSTDFRVAILLLVVSFSVYLSNGRLISSGDNYPARYLPFSILKHGTLYLDPIVRVVAQGDPHPYWIINRRGHAVSFYPVVVPLVVAPLYVPSVVWLNMRGWTEQRLDQTARLMEKCVSALIASLSVALMYGLLRRRADPGLALLLAVAYAFGTNTWMIGSQALWQHGVAELFLVAALLLLTGPYTDKRAVAVGLLCGLIACNRPPDALLSLALGIYGLVWSGRGRWLLVTGAVVPLVLLLVYNGCVVHEWFGGYARKGDLSSFRYGLLTGVAGLLFNPAHGLFIFTPFLLFLPFGIKSVLADSRFRRLDLLLLAAIVLQVLFYAKLDWRAGSAWGPRWLTDILPLMIWMLVPVVVHAGRCTRILFVVAVCFSIGVQAVGAFWYTGKSDEIILAEAGDPWHVKRLWDFRITPYVVEWAHGPAPRGILHKMSGHIDNVQANGRNADEVVMGSAVRIEGWTLTNGHTPARVAVSLLPVGKTKWRGPNHYPVALATDFGPRPDVSEKYRGAGVSGWSVTLSTDGYDPGEHMVVVKAAAHDLGEFHPVARRRVRVIDGNHRGENTLAVDWDQVAKEAMAHLKANQQPGGYWLTAHTHAERFVHPKKEMNTFLGAMMIDLLQPIAGEIGLRESLDLASRHLADQIEPDGLVRYHGRPDSPTIPALGCVITPDADDTALAWRITGGGDPSLLPGVLRVLNRYKTPEGLYRTWLAPVDQYISIDPGKDPNPADMVIQMHVLMFLDAVDKVAARSLFEALQREINDDSHWIYYQKAPLVPLLRQDDLRKLGYSLALPPERIQATARGQEPWVALCRLISSESPTTEDNRAAARLLLGRLAANHFSELKTNPPLMYHNDFSAKASRFYWSEDFGYALWLRLYSKYGTTETQAR